MATAPLPSPAGPEPESLAGLFEALESPLLTYALRLVPDNAMAQDLVQEAFLRLHTQFDTVREPRRWLYRTVHNLALNRLRDRRRIIPLPGLGPAEGPDAASELSDPLPLPDEQLARDEAVGLVRRGLEHLDERSRRLLDLKFSEDLSYADISARMGLTVGHVGYLLHHSLKALAAELAKAGLVP